MCKKPVRQIGHWIWFPAETSFVKHNFPFPPGLENIHFLQRFHQNEISRVAFPQQPDGKPVMLNRMQAGGPKHIEQVKSFCQSPAHQQIDVSKKQVIRVFIVGTKHHLTRIMTEQIDQCFKVSGSTAFADQNFHPHCRFFHGFFQREAFVIRLDTGCEIVFCLLSTQSGCVPVDRNSQFFRQGQFFHHHLILKNDTRPVHHFGQIVTGFVLQKATDSGSIDLITRRFKCSRRNAGRCPEMEMEWGWFSVFCHPSDTFLSQNIGNFMRIRHSGQSSMFESHRCKLTGRQHRTLDVHVCIHKTWKNKNRRC